MFWASSESDAKNILKQVVIETSGDNIRDDGPHFHGGNSGYGVNYRLRVPRRLAVDADTTNGGVTLKIPEHYSAHLETGTVNGGISLNFPITIQGDIKNRLSTTLGSGGPTIHAETTNGGVHIDRARGAE